MVPMHKKKLSLFFAITLIAMGYGQQVNCGVSIVDQKNQALSILQDMRILNETQVKQCHELFKPLLEDKQLTLRKQFDFGLAYYPWINAARQHQSDRGIFFLNKLDLMFAMQMDACSEKYQAEPLKQHEKIMIQNCFEQSRYFIALFVEQLKKLVDITISSIDLTLVNNNLDRVQESLLQHDLESVGFIRNMSQIINIISKINGHVVGKKKDLETLLDVVSNHQLILLKESLERAISELAMLEESLRSVVNTRIQEESDRLLKVEANRMQCAASPEKSLIDSHFSTLVAKLDVALEALTKESQQDNLMATKYAKEIQDIRQYLESRREAIRNDKADLLREDIIRFYGMYMIALQQNMDRKIKAISQDVVLNQVKQAFVEIQDQARACEVWLKKLLTEKDS